MAQPTFHTVFAEEYDPTAYERMRSIGRVTVLSSHDQASLLSAVGDCDALLVRSYAQITREVIREAGRLRVIGRGGVGIDNIDLEAARERGVIVVYTPEASTAAAADLTVGLMISLLRHVVLGDALLRKGRFQAARGLCIGREMRELTLGIMGMGRIGKAVARRCRCGFGMNILYNDIVDPGALDFEATSVSKQQLYKDADIVSLHVPLTDQTRNIINDASLSCFKRGRLLINTSRGAVVDCQALANHLKTEHIGGAALDVTEPEPLPVGHPLLQAPHTLLTPHIGGRTRSSLDRMNAVVEDVIRVLEGNQPLFPALP